MTYSEQTRRVAKDIIDTNQGPRGLQAGSTHFNDLWARDALYASWGARHHDSDAVRRTLSTLQSHMRDGQIPLRVGRKSMVNVFLGLPTETGPVYTNDKSNDAAIDPNLLYIITAATFIRDNPDARDRFAQSVDDALAWVERRADNILIEEAPYAAWDDALKKHGVTAYTNVLYAAAVQTMSEAFDEPTYAERARVVERRLRSALWTGSYYKAWGERDVCDVAANLLAVLFDIGPAEHHRSILNFLDTKQRANNDVLYKTNYPSYPWHDTYLPFHLVGMSDYHNSGPYWTWITALETLARDQLQTTPGDNADRLDTIIQDHGDIAEILNEHREPVRRLFYQSEQRFTWTAGLILAHTPK